LPEPADEVNVVEPPAQNVAVPDIVGVDGIGFTVKVLLAVAVQPAAFVTVTV
jgi:hypothetical protein